MISLRVPDRDAADGKVSDQGFLQPGLLPTQFLVAIRLWFGVDSTKKIYEK